MIKLEDEDKLVEKPPAIGYKVVLRRRGSDFIFSATDDGHVVVSRKNHRTKQYKHYLHPHTDIQPFVEQIKAHLQEGKYKLVEAGKTDTIETPDKVDDA